MPGPAHVLYRTPRWRALRRKVLAAQPVCALCLTARSTVCDHVRPHRGDADAFWRGPFQALCKRCHDVTKQLAERSPHATTALDGWPVDGSSITETFSRLTVPDDLAPSRPPLHFVCGPPGAGKSTYVETHAHPRAAVVDADRNAQRLRFPRYGRPVHQWREVLRARNRDLRALAASDAPEAWVVFGGARATDREALARQLRPVSVTVLLTPAEVCWERIQASRDVGAHVDEARGAVWRWWAQYTPRGGEALLRC